MIGVCRKAHPYIITYYYLRITANDLLTMNYHKWVVNAFLLPKNIYEIVHGHFC